MSEWTSGYVADIGYTYGYYLELNPLRTQLAFLNAGLACPSVRNACELGFGQGISVNLHAAGNTSCAWYGTDFNPSQAGFAQSLASASGAQAHLFDEAFADFCSRSDLPEFDYIGIHGIWSWISDENRQVIVDFVRRKLAVGGVLYISYNTLPGWSAAAPLRHLLTQHADAMTGSGHGILNRVEAALGFTQQLLDTQPLYTLANTQVPERFAKLKDQNKSYLAHEYFNRDWHPMYFADMAQWLEPAKLSFACSTHLLDHVEAINLSTEQQTLLNGLPDPLFRQTVRDYLVNQQFRKDYWVKGPRRLDPLVQAEQLRALRVILTTPRADVPLKVQGARGEATLNESVYVPILDRLADHRIQRVGDLESALRDKGVNFPQLIQSLIVLAGMGHVTGAQDEATIKASLKTSQKLNLTLMHQARSQGEISYLTSPVTGGGITVPRFPQLFLLALLNGKKQPEEWAAFVWQLLAAQGQSILKDGQPLPTPEANLAELTQQAQAFAEKQLPIMKALQVV